MSTITITIRTGNAAFHDCDGDGDGLERGHEVARILRALADQYERAGATATPLLDFNGNRVGNVEDTQEEAERS